MIFDLTFSPDGKHIATASKDGTVKIWTLDSLRQPARESDPESSAETIVTPTSAGSSGSRRRDRPARRRPTGSSGRRRTWPGPRWRRLRVVAAMPLGFMPISRLFAAASWWVSRSTMGVSVSQGQTAKTLMFSLAKPAATDWVMLITPAWVAPSRTASGNGKTVPTNDEVLTMMPPSLPGEDGEDLLHAEEHALEVDRQDVVHDLLGAGADRAQHALDPRVVEQEVQAAVELERLVEEGADGILDPDVGPQELDLVTLLRQVVGGGLAPNMIAPGDHDLAPPAASRVATALPIPVAPPVTTATFPAKASAMRASTMSAGSIQHQ